MSRSSLGHHLLRVIKIFSKTINRFNLLTNGCTQIGQPLRIKNSYERYNKSFKCMALNLSFPYRVSPTNDKTNVSSISESGEVIFKAHIPKMYTRVKTPLGVKTPLE